MQTSQSVVIGEAGPELEGKGKNVNIFRRIMRRIRKKIRWNQMPMRYQMRVRLFSLFILFLVLYAAFMVIYSYSIYEYAVITRLNPQWPNILQKRLEFSTESISTALYMVDKIFIDSSMRMFELFSQADKSLFPVNEEAFDIFDASEFDVGQRVELQGSYCADVRRN